MKTLFALFLTVISVNVFADIVKPLSAGDPLAKVARAIGTQLNDGNITTGTTSLWAGKLKTSETLNTPEFKALVKKGMTDALKDNSEGSFENQKIEITVGKFTDGDGKNGSVYKMTEAIMESNDYNPDNRELREAQARYLWVVLRKFPVSKETLIGHARMTLEGKAIQYFLLVNKDSKAVQLFTIQGSM